MRRALAVAAATLLLALTALGGASASTFTQRLYLRNDGGASCPGFPYLSIAAGADEPGCGYQAGAPLGEVYGLTGTASNVRVYDTLNGITPKVLDALRPASGNIRVFSWVQTGRIGAGTIRVDVTLTARRADSSAVTLGTSSQQRTVDPTNSAEIDIPFSIAIPDDLDKTEMANIALQVDIRGVHVGTGYQRLNGQSWLDVPTHNAPQVPVPAPAPTPSPTPGAPAPAPSPTPSPTATAKSSPAF